MKTLNAENVLIIGGGVSAKGAAYALDKAGIKNYCHDDSKSDDRSYLDETYDLIVVSPGVWKNHYIYDYAFKKGIEIIGELELGWRLNEGKIIAVTGTNGKTTTAKMLARLLSKKYKVALCGNIGVSFSATAADGNYDIAVVEVSSFQLESIKNFRPDIAIITNISEDHLDRHGSMAEYASLKKRITENQTPNDLVIISQDGIALKYLTDFSPESKVIFTCRRGKINGTYADNGKIYTKGGLIFDLEMLPFNDEHNIENFLSAVTAAELMGLNSDDICDGISDFAPDPHRIQLVRTLNGVKFYDDSKGTNVAATLCALKKMQGSVCLIAGGKDKNCPFNKLFTTDADLVKINLIGETKYKIRDTAYLSGFSEVEIFDTMEEAVENAYYSGCDNVLLSPATSSFDMYDNYIDRAKKFMEAVYALK